MNGAQHNRLTAIIETALAQPAYPAAQRMVDALRAAHGPAVRAVLFYGSCRRARQPDGVMDFYVLVDSYRAYHGSLFRSLINYLMPPDVSFMRIESGPSGDADGGVIAAKVAVISLDQFARRMRARAIDTTMWARFTQPSTLLYAADDAVRKELVMAIEDAVRTATCWAIPDAPVNELSAAFWNRLFAMTYDAELRVERGDRPQTIYGNDPDYYDGIFNALELEFTNGVRVHDRRGSWALRRMAGKPLSILRLAKGAFTFDGGVDYLLWKIERHTGARVILTPWQRRHPILAAPRLLYRLYRQGILR